jgi:hypothetical protein
MGRLSSPASFSSTLAPEMWLLLPGFELQADEAAATATGGDSDINPARLSGKL